MVLSIALFCVILEFPAADFQKLKNIKFNHFTETEDITDSLLSRKRKNRRKIDSMAQTKLAAAHEIVIKHGIKIEEDIADLKKRLQSLPSYIRSLESVLASEKQRLQRVTNLADAYEKVVGGNFPERLVQGGEEDDCKRDTSV